MTKRCYLIFIKFSLLSAVGLLGGCSKIVLFDPKGPVGDSERFVIFVAFALMLIVVIPVFVMVFLFARKYRYSNSKATYAPKWSYSAKIDFVIWIIPVIIVTALGILTWSETHHLNPYKPIDHGVEPINIQAVSMDWKWLFIYPDQNIATVNELVFPVNVPLSFRITSDTVMTSFFIPQLGSQIYAMAGMQTRLHLMAEEAGVYLGQNQQFSGSGYADMNFKAIATPGKQFKEWVQKIKQTSGKLDLDRFEELGKPNTVPSAIYFSSVKPALFDHILNKYRPAGLNSDVMGEVSDPKQLKSGIPEER